jgi:hypothetical protein
MKNRYSYLCILTILVSALFVNQSCDKPFDGVNAILTNVKIDHSVNIQITDANPAATNPYPAKPILTLGGDAVDRGLIYSTAGQPLTAVAGSATVINNAINLAVRPFTKISKSQPLRFYIKAEAANYLSNTKEIIITSLDSLQYVKLALLKISSLPQGVAHTNTSTTAVAGKIAKDFVVKVTSKVAGTSTTETVVTATFPANTVFKDATNAIITTAGDLNISVFNFSAATPEAISALPGGLMAATTATTDLSTFILAGAVDINANVGGTPIKSFNTPIPFDIKLSAGVFNPTTQTTIKVGDQLPVWSKDANSVVWKNEGLATVINDAATGNLKTTIQVSHLSTWMVAYNNPACATTTNLNYISNSNTAITALVKINLKGGNNQLIATKTISITNGNLIELQLPKDLNLTVTVYDASSSSGIPFSTINLTACATSGTITNTEISTNPILSFDLETSCMNGKFRYSGPIDYKVSGTTLWLPFTPSEVGKLSTNLLAWDKTYDFRIIYRDVEYKRSRAVLQSEFRQAGNVWEYFGKTAVKQTFFSSPTSCN